MSAFSDFGKTLSSAFSATRKTAELVEVVVGDEFMTGIVKNTGKIANVSLSNAATMVEVESRIELANFMKDNKAALKDLEKVPTV